MRKTHFILLPITFLFFSCYHPERNCKTFKNGTFTYTATIDGKEKTTTFKRNGNLEIDFFESKSDTASVRWLNDCEYIVKKINPKNKAEEKSIHIKIMSTTDNSYTFEYGVVGSSKKTIGNAIKTK